MRWQSSAILTLAFAILGSACRPGLAGHEARSHSALPHFADVPAEALPGIHTTLDEVIRRGDTITFLDRAHGSNVVAGVVKQDGTITLPPNRVFIAEGKTLREVLREIQISYGRNDLIVERPPYRMDEEVKIIRDASGSASK
jgi:hypothetical protein